MADARRNGFMRFAEQGKCSPGGYSMCHTISDSASKSNSPRQYIIHRIRVLEMDETTGFISSDALR
ncbi:pentatricopeptide repeat-containing protein [Pyrus ussuriensis x Pyrus communis]|uniref:Pentatricopeptide repeat-containing protein n=1 Tax=Pyrus ussuriensis x Pyrus communis TaxID=2448454 RepID=A0A5N5FA51_9ROSA|nr:pentatricopeptide repeat-containing protein [Pyrus ussuriensis x Pyrus communis]